MVIMPSFFFWTLFDGDEGTFLWFILYSIKTLGFSDLALGCGWRFPWSLKVIFTDFFGSLIAGCEKGLEKWLVMLEIGLTNYFLNYELLRPGDIWKFVWEGFWKVLRGLEGMLAGWGNPCWITNDTGLWTAFFYGLILSLYKFLISKSCSLYLLFLYLWFSLDYWWSDEELSTSG